MQNNLKKQVKTLTLEQFIEYRNKIVVRMNARSRNFPEQDHYYKRRLEELDSKYPAFKAMGVINLKIKE